LLNPGVITANSSKLDDLGKILLSQPLASLSERRNVYCIIVIKSIIDNADKIHPNMSLDLL